MSSTPFAVNAELELQQAVAKLELAARFHRIASQLAEARLATLGSKQSSLEYRLKAQARLSSDQYWRCIRALNELESPEAPAFAIASGPETEAVK